MSAVINKQRTATLAMPGGTVDMQLTVDFGPVHVTRDGILVLKISGRPFEKFRPGLSHPGRHRTLTWPSQPKSENSWTESEIKQNAKRLSFSIPNRLEGCASDDEN